jgi:hypothetical protein
VRPANDRLSFAAKVMDLTYAQAADIEPMMKEIAIMTDLRHDNIVRYIGSDCNMAKKEVRRRRRNCVPCRVCVVSCRVVSCRVVSCRVVSCRVVSCRVVSCRVCRVCL